MKERFESLNGLRALACVGIILMHIMSNIVVKPSDNFLTENIIAFTGDFVMMFMMVSAFSLCCGYYQRFKDQTISLNDFYAKRYKRILPFFALLVLIDVAFCFVTEHFSFTGKMCGELWEAYADLTLAFGLMPGNNISVIGVGWFLGVIFFFYMLFPFFVFLIGSKKSAWISLLIVLGLYLSALFYFVPVKNISFGHTSIVNCMPYFLIGGLIYLYRDSIKTINRYLLLSISVLYTCLFFCFLDMRFEFSNLIMYSIWLIYAVNEVSADRRWTLLNNKVVTFISGISMEMYLSHMLVFRVVEKAHLERFVSNNDLLYIIVSLLVIGFSILFALGWKKIEARLKFLK